MAIVPLWAATDGLIYQDADKPALEIGVRGLLLFKDILPGPDPVPKPEIVRGGGGKYKGKLPNDTKLEQRLKDIKLREDEEILVIIKAFIQCQ